MDTTDGNSHREGVGDCLQEFFQKDFFFFLTTRLLKRFRPDVSGGVDPDGKPNSQFQKGLNQNPAVEPPIEKPNPPAITDILGIAMGNQAVLRVESGDMRLQMDFKTHTTKFCRPSTSVGGTRFALVLIDRDFEMKSKGDVSGFLDQRLAEL